MRKYSCLSSLKPSQMRWDETLFLLQWRHMGLLLPKDINSRLVASRDDATRDIFRPNSTVR